MTSRYLDNPPRSLDHVLRERTAITADQPDAFAAGGSTGLLDDDGGLTGLEFEPSSEEDQLSMIRDFSAEHWAAECDEHGVALRLALAIFSKTKPELVDITAELLEDADGKATVMELLKRWAAARDRFRALAVLLQGAIDRQGCAILNADVDELPMPAA